MQACSALGASVQFVDMCCFSLAGATATGTCNLCQAGTYSTILGPVWLDAGVSNQV